MLRKKKSVVGLDIGTNSVKALEVIRDRSGVLVTGFAQVATPSSASRRDAVAEAFRRGGFRTRRVVAAVSGRSLLVRYLTVPRMAPDEFQRSLHIDLERHLPLPAEEAQVDWKILGEAPAVGETKEPKMRVLLVGVRRSFVADLATMLLDLGLLPVSVDADLFAIGNAFELGARQGFVPGTEDGAAAVVDVGAAKTCVHVVAGGSSQFAREVPIGGNDLSDSIGRRLSLDAAEAEARKRSPEERLDEVREAMDPVLEDLANEVALSFEYYEQGAQKSVGTVYLCGGSARSALLAERLGAALERTVQVWNPLEGFPIRSGSVEPTQLEAAGPALAVALGLAARGAGALPGMAA